LQSKDENQEPRIKSQESRAKNQEKQLNASQIKKTNSGSRFGGTNNLIAFIFLS
jgi:hypothetical protein